MDDDDLFLFIGITAHQGPLTKEDPQCKGSSYNVIVECETGETSYEPWNLIATDDPITCAAYAKRNWVLDHPGWKFLKWYAKTSKRLMRAAKTIQDQANKKIHHVQAWVPISQEL